MPFIHLTIMDRSIVLTRYWPLSGSRIIGNIVEVEASNLKKILYS